MRKQRATALVFLILAVGISLAALGPAEAARRKGGRFNGKQAFFYIRACLDGLNLTIADTPPLQWPTLKVVGDLMRVDPFGTSLSADVELEPLDPPLELENGASYAFGGRTILRPAPGTPWKVGDRLSFTVTSPDGQLSASRQAATVMACSAADAEPELYDYRPTPGDTPFNNPAAAVDDDFTVGMVRVALRLSYQSTEPKPFRVSLVAPDGRSVALVDVNTSAIDLGNSFFLERPEGGAEALVFDPGSSYAFGELAGNPAYNLVAVRPADAAGLRALAGARSKGQWRLDVRYADGPVVPNPPNIQFEYQWKLELTRASSVYLPLLRSGGAAPQPRDLTIYDNALASGWEAAGWSYGATVDLASTARAVSAPNAIAVTFTEGFGGLSFRSASPIAAGEFQAITFWVWGAPGGSPLSVYSQPADDGPTSALYTFTAPGGAWAEISVPLSALGSPATIKRFAIQDDSGGSGSTIYVDDVRLAP
jgi:hypothetical protein